MGIKGPIENHEDESTISTLSAEEQELSVKASRSLIQALYEDSRNRSSVEDALISSRFNSEREIFEALPLSEEDIQDFESRLYTPRLSAFTLIFLREVVRFVHEMRKAAKHRHLNTFLFAFREKFLSVSPCIINYLNFVDQLIFATESSRIPETMGWFSTSSVGEFVNTLAFSSDDIVEQIAEAIGERPTAEIVDVIHIIHNIGAQALADGDWAFPAYKRCMDLLQKISQIRIQPIVQYALDNALEGLEKELGHPTKSAVAYMGNPIEGRPLSSFSSEMQKEDEIISRKIVPFAPFLAGDRFTKIAKDAVAIADHSNMVQQIGFYSINESVDISGPSLAAVQEAMNGIDRENLKRYPGDFLLFLHNEIFYPAFGQDCYEKWHEVIPEFSTEELRSIITTEQDLSAFRLRDEKMRVELHAKAKQNMCVLLIEKARDLLHKLPSEIIARIHPDMLATLESDSNQTPYQDTFYAAIDFLKFAIVLGKSRSEIAEILGNERGLTVAQAERVLRDFGNEDGMFLPVRDAAEAEYQIFLQENREMEADIKERLSRKLQKEFHHGLANHKKNLSQLLESLAKTMDEQRTSVSFYLLDELIEDPFLSPYIKDPENDSRLLQQLHRPELRERIERDLGCSIRDISLHSQLQLLRFLVDENRETFNRLRTVLEMHPGIRDAILSAFLVCASNSELGNDIISLAERADSEATFPLIADILGIVDEKYTLMKGRGGERIGKSDKFDSVILKRTIALIKEVCALPEDVEMEHFIDQAKQYQHDTIAWGALFKAVASNDQHGPISPDEMSFLYRDIKVDTVPCGSLVSKLDRDKMQSAENYANPKLFGPREYDMIVRNLRKAYRDVDPGWLEVLIDNIPRDLNDPNTTFVLVKNQKTGDLVGVIKFRSDPDNPGAYYLGTMYVDEGFEKGFGVGDYLQQTAASLMEKGAPYSGSVALSNVAMERHINVAGAVGTALVFEEDGQHSSKELLKVSWNTGFELRSKNADQFSEERIKKMAEEGFEEDGIAARLFNTSIGESALFVKSARKFLDEGYVISRYFYGQKNGKPDLRKTYVVFEKVKKREKRSDLQVA